MLTDPLEDYARGSVPFLGVEVFLDSHPLIPRTETEYWVERAIAEILDVGHQVVTTDVGRPQFRVLDLFAGSGCIGLGVLKHISNAHVTFAEKEVRHFPTIRKSAAAILASDARMAAQVACVESDVWSAFSTLPALPHTAGALPIPMSDVGRRTWGEFDYVLANPPYVSEERGTVSSEALAYEPPEALFAPGDGFEFIEKTIAGLPRHLAPEGAAWIEHEPFHTAKISTCAKTHGLSATTHTDQHGVERFTRMTHKGVA